MTSRSTTPSEGEIVETDEKATKSLPSAQDQPVDRPSRQRVSPPSSRSPSPYRAPRPRDDRSRSRSPYRENRGSKRPRHEDHYSSRRDRREPKHSRDAPRYGGTRSAHGDFDRDAGSSADIRYDDRAGSARSIEKRPRTVSRSPPRAHDRRPGPRTDSFSSRGGKSSGIGYHTSARDGPTKRTKEQSVGKPAMRAGTAAALKADAEQKTNQATRGVSFTMGSKEGPAITDNNAEAAAPEAEPVDEATLIEKRRKRREAIMAKHKASNNPLLIQALTASNNATPSESSPATPDSASPAIDSLQISPPSTPREGSGSSSPTTIQVVKDADLADDSAQANGVLGEDEPSAADYDPTMDMQEDRLRQDSHQQGKEVPAAAYDETRNNIQDVLIPDGDQEQPDLKKARNDFDMFADDEVDMFAEAPTGKSKATGESAKAVPVPRSKAIDMSMLDDFDDDEGYYKIILGELLDSRYHVQLNLGKGMFSAVVRAMDQATQKLVAIKIIRSNETMRKAALKEIDILRTLSAADPDDKKHMVRLERHFEHKGHLCMVFENLSINLREVLKKFGRDVGINLKAVRAYAQQMFLGLSLLRKCNILHADLKPDNVLVNESRNMLKICDLGSASDASENEITPYLVSRFYRAPEIILGLPYDFAIDTWSIGCTLFELYTGKILFTGRTNNQMLRSVMECRGKFSSKLLRKAQFAPLHFDDLLNFRSVETDKISGKDTMRVLNFNKATRDLRTRLLGNAKRLAEGEAKELNLFVDLLERCLNLNPERRCTPAEALKHPFILRSK